MRINTYEEIVILAVNKPTEIEDQYQLTKLIGKPYTRPALTGCYKGETERSYIVPMSVGLDNILSFARDHRQETVLYLDNQREAFLIDCQTEEDFHIGTFKGVQRERALACEGWTLNNETNQYYIVE